MSHSEAFINGWKAHQHYEELLSQPHNPYNPETQNYSFTQWHAGLMGRKDWVELGSSVHHPDAAVENY